MSKSLLITAIFAIGAGAGSFYVGRVGSASRTSSEPPGGSASCCNHPSLCNWLRLSSDQCRLVRRADPKFSDESDLLLKNMEQQRDRLASVLETTSSTDGQITEQVERLITAHDALERRIAKHLLTIRPLLTPEQARHLMGLAASGVRHASPTTGPTAYRASWDVGSRHEDPRAR